MTGNTFAWLAAGVPAIIGVMVYAAIWLVAPRFAITIDPVIIAVQAMGLWYGLMLFVAIMAALNSP